MSKERVLITVKTYPTLSRKYGETVCTAGVREDGSWVRIYPVPFRRLDEAEQYRKFDWVECRLGLARGDPRPESRNPLDVTELVPKGHMDTADGWRERRQLLLGKAKVYTNLNELIVGAKENRLSLAVFKPTKVLGFTHEDEDREWNADKVAELRARASQVDMFDEESWRKTFKLIPEMGGFSPRNLKYMRSFAAAWPDRQIVQAPLAQLSWYHHLALLEKLATTDQRLWYAAKALEQGWSRNVLAMQIQMRVIERQGTAQNNFPATLPPPDSDMAVQIFKDPYLFDFLGTDAPRREKELEAGLVDHIQKFLLELGQGFAFVGRQVHLEVGGRGLLSRSFVLSPQAAALHRN